MKITWIVGDILDVEVEGLISTGNAPLNMSGGINGELMMRYGTIMEDAIT